jgi:hypothetical protein
MTMAGRSLGTGALDLTAQKLWPRWTAANAVAELFGLGITFAVMAALLPLLDSQQTAGLLLGFGVAVLSGSFEATVVGLAQWWAFKPWLPSIRWRDWWLATLIGALLGYVLGYLPSTLMSLGEAAGEAPMEEPPQWVVLLLAAGMGAAAGAVLSFMQSRVLRKAGVPRAWRWIPANMLAWAAGMPVIFAGMDLAFAQPMLWMTLVVIGGALLLAGALVGAIHGWFLVRMVREH